MRANDVFTPTGVPTVTYVNRSDRGLEDKLRNAIRTHGTIASLSGPSKSGKTVLVRKVLDPDCLITVSGGAIKSAEQLWDRVLNWMEAPSSTTSGSSHTVGVNGEATAGGKVGLFGTKVEAEAKAGGKYDYARSTTDTFARNGIDQVVKEIANSEFVVFIDDFHYMPHEVQSDVAKQIKEAAEKGVNICTASVPHRADDVVRGNPELRGRVQGVDFEYWSTSETLAIAQQGFAELNVDLPREVLNRMVSEAFGSPQLMQQICLQACYRLKIDDRSFFARKIDVPEAELLHIFEQASTTTDFSSLLDAMHTGPKVRGAPRNQFDFTDGSRGDVYRCILLALRQNPPQLSFTYDDIYRRTRAVCTGEPPAGSSVAQALDQIDAIALATEPTVRIIEWKDDVLDIVDPYFLYYLRCSARLKAIQRRV